MRGQLSTCVMLLASSLLLQLGSAASNRIDTHHHLIPPGYIDYLAEYGLNSSQSEIPLPDWTPESSLKYMEDFGIAGAILSLSSPGLPFGDEEVTKKMARQANEYAAKVVAQHPGRFGFFAFLPMPFLEASVEEARYALDILRADGVVLLGNARGRYFSEPELHPLLAELDKRKTVAFVHPNQLPGPVVPGLPPFVADFLLDTVRAAFFHVSSGAAAGYPDVKLILAHAGAFLPYSAARIGFALSAVRSQDLRQAAAPDEADLDALKRFYMDTALSSSPFAFPSLLAFTTPSRITFGSDFPFAPAPVGRYFASELDKHFASDAASLAQVNSGTAAALFPRFAQQCRAAGGQKSEL